MECLPFISSHSTTKRRRLALRLARKPPEQQEPGLISQKTHLFGNSFISLSPLRPPGTSPGPGPIPECLTHLLQRGESGTWQLGLYFVVSLHKRTPALLLERFLDAAFNAHTWELAVNLGSRAPKAPAQSAGPLHKGHDTSRKAFESHLQLRVRQQHTAPCLGNAESTASHLPRGPDVSRPGRPSATAEPRS